jgi:exonuclease V gamma subunit
MKDEAIDLAEKERMMREAGITKETLDKIQSWIKNTTKAGEPDD